MMRVYWYRSQLAGGGLASAQNSSKNACWHMFGSMIGGATPLHHSDVRFTVGAPLERRTTTYLVRLRRPSEVLSTSPEMKLAASDSASTMLRPGFATSAQR